VFGACRRCVIVSVTFGVIQRVVSASHQLVRAFWGFPCGESDRAGVGTRHPGPQPLAEIGRVGVAAPGHHHGELVSTDAGEHVVWA